MDVMETYIQSMALHGASSSDLELGSQMYPLVQSCLAQAIIAYTEKYLRGSLWSSCFLIHLQILLADVDSKIVFFETE